MIKIIIMVLVYTDISGKNWPINCYPNSSLTFKIKYFKDYFCF
jgi:hypothetical protein